MNENLLTFTIYIAKIKEHLDKFAAYHTAYKPEDFADEQNFAVWHALFHAYIDTAESNQLLTNQTDKIDQSNEQPPKSHSTHKSKLHTPRRRRIITPPGFGDASPADAN